MRRLTICFVGLIAATVLAEPATAGTSSSIAALQVALRAKGHYAAAVDGVDGPLTRAGLTAFQQTLGLASTGRVEQKTRAALGPLGSPLLGQRELGVGAVGWDVSSLEFKLIPFGLSPKAVDGRFNAATARALARLQAAHGLPVDGIAGKQTYRTLTTHAKAASEPPVQNTYIVRAGDSFYSIAGSLGISPLLLASENRLKLTTVIVPGQKLTLPAGATTQSASRVIGSAAPVTSDLVRTSLDHWSAVYGVDPKLARALAWMESGFRSDVVSSAGAVGVMQLLPGTWKWIDEALLRTVTARTYDGNIRVGVRYLRWLLDEFGGDVRLALAGYYQGAQAVRDRGLFDDTKRYVAIVLKLYGTV